VAELRWHRKVGNLQPYRRTRQERPNMALRGRARGACCAPRAPPRRAPQAWPAWFQSGLGFRPWGVPVMGRGTCVASTKTHR
jgi:hypothetical protein